MTLRDYVRKRRFDATPEPDADRGRAGRGRRKAPIFVVQLHHARARHYDFRLEADGVLKSWAVPKGPSLRAGERRLAVEVEDHPLSYADFEGDIPEGQYGAGHVDIFDHGTWRTDDDALDQIAAGKLDFELDGERLHGRFTLVRTRPVGKQQQWLLIKRSDEHARDSDADRMLDEPAAIAQPAAPLPKQVAGKSRAASAKARGAGSRGSGVRSSGVWRNVAAKIAGAVAAPMPKDVELQLATLRERPPSGSEWQFEVKWDGYRMLAYVQRGVRLQSRNKVDWSERFAHLAEAIAGLSVRSAILDGELIASDRSGRSDFGELQRLLESGQLDSLHYVIFDLLYLDGIDLRGAAQAQRRGLLREVLAASTSDALAFSEHVEGDAGQVLAASVKAGLEGIICKRADAPYHGGRSQAWIKLKHVADEEFIVVGHTPPKHGRQGFGSLLLARPGADGLAYVGRVGSGFSDAALRSLSKRLQALHSEQAAVELPGHVPFPRRSVRWVAPELVVDVHSRGRGKEGLIRQASFVRLREDKRAADLSAAVAAAQAEPAPRRARAGRARPLQETAMSDTRLSHPERIVYPVAKISKGEVADYYRAVEAWLLPELVERPLSLLRCPDGIASACFFQKHHADSLGEGVHPVRLRESAGQADYVYVRDIEGVSALVQMNTLEFHPWGAKRQAPDRPDRLVFDLDPAEDIAWSELKRAGREVRDRLAEIGLDSWPRLSGGKGMHVVVPIRPGPRWAEAKAFSEAFADAMVAQSPLRYVATASKVARKGRIFIDWLRNARGATSVASWSLRAREGAPVAMPLRWDEFSRARSSTDFDLAKALRRAARLRSDPWEGFAESRQRLPTI
ncbi:DNA ligase D [Lysobacter antibioticus]|uniref:DNA ligase (ATP) n=1 Tax=Lysobacter antibioticus TaxID=84531 RepID=A0A0S2FBC9_LYSAN|nr:DNA ligase D [Lysobacter antibioticus]ALN80872.1 DNA ligase D [Lysobacter antibioticus]